MFSVNLFFFKVSSQIQLLHWALKTLMWRNIQQHCTHFLPFSSNSVKTSSTTWSESFTPATVAATCFSVSVKKPHTIWSISLLYIMKISQCKIKTHTTFQTVLLTLINGDTSQMVKTKGSVNIINTFQKHPKVQVLIKGNALQEIIVTFKYGVHCICLMNLSGFVWKKTR